MRSSDLLSPLLRELHRASLLARAPAFADALRAFGLTPYDCPLWGVASVEADEVFYQPSEEGILSAIVPAYEGPRIVDLVACCFATREMRTRKGIASVLGHEWIEDSFLGNEPLKIFDNALTWLRGKCRGVVVLDWNDAPLLFFTPSGAASALLLMLGDWISLRTSSLKYALRRNTARSISSVTTTRARTKNAMMPADPSYWEGPL